jgi:hypothetical protein
VHTPDTEEEDIIRSQKGRRNNQGDGKEGLKGGRGNARETKGKEGGAVRADRVSNEWKDMYG